MRRRRPGLLRAALDLVTAAAVGVAARDLLRPVDERARARIASQRRPLLDEWMPVVTDLGSVYGAAGAAAALWLGGKQRLARDVFGAAMLAWGAAQGAKRLFNRTRPYHAGDVDILVREPAGTSYPSGHPAVAQAMASVLAAEVPGFVQGPLEALPRLVGFSRIYVGVHYPSDVYGGILVGRAAAAVWRRFASR